ncbi:tripartite tricarboxylate transporter substrate binding protein [Alkalihalobacillus sp. AL-G]|uniref:tripartite tricarboxylate transporter substrate binding protein n=1 Tax=Alkalihalobacillus sp. AL-G TaxID=2926399 RepID=UPI00272B1459|nr:tripartite tricarboxylate transporter substrate binding protein [Alkalihalobacillus sp. AL-G]WLD92039.1 tripartite tricarboxylate transporter substrate binding protein [Alkalihalobacillus sp. AL-G]
MLNSKHFAITLYLVFVTVLISGCSSTQNSSDGYPEKPIQIIVAYSPGGATDTQARIIAEYAQEYLGQELAVVNKPGGGGQVGWNYFSSVDPDGYTLTAYNLPHVITQPLVGDTSYELDTFEPIVNWGKDPTVFAVPQDSEITDLQDLIDKARQSPDQITVGHSGKFVGQHMAILLLEHSANIQLKDIPFKGSAEGIASMLGNHTDVMSGNLSDLYRLGDQVRLLAIATEERHPFVPDLPTFGELGHTKVVMSTDRGIAAREGTPDKIIKKLEKAFMELLQDEEFLADMKKSGADMLILDRENVLTEFEIRHEQYQKLLESIGIK